MIKVFEVPGHPDSLVDCFLVFVKDIIFKSSSGAACLKCRCKLLLMCKMPAACLKRQWCP